MHLQFRSGRSVITATLALAATLALTAAASASVTTTGDVAPVPPVGGGPVVGPLTIGNAGTGTVSVTAGTAITNSNNAILGDASTGIGIITLSGLGSDWTLTTAGADLTVGDAGTGSITVSSSARLTVPGDSFLGGATTGMGRVTVSGLGSVWQNSSTVLVGQNGLGIVDVLSGGQYNVGNISIGSNSASVGSVTVSGELSRLSVVGALSVGNGGHGTLQILGGARLAGSSSAGLAIGDSGTGIGVVEVSGAGSLFEIDALLANAVGNFGSGTARVLDGGRLVSYADVFVAANSATATGEIVVDGADSRFTIAGALNSGLGDASVTLTAGGVLTTTIASTLGPTARLTLDGGRWESIAAGAAALTAQGLIQGSGTLDVAGLTLNLSGSTRGRLHAAAGDQLLITGSLTNTAGVIDLAGGELEVRGTIANSHNIDLRNGATLRVGSTGLDNNANSQLAITGGTVDVFGAVDNNVGAEIAVVGDAIAVFHDAVVNNGDVFVAPGSQIVLLEDLGFSGSSALSVALADTDPDDDPSDAFGQASTAGKAAIDGTLNVSLVGGFIPTLGETYQIVSAAAGRSGTFDTEALPMLGGNLALDVVYTANAVTLAVVPELTGDYNANGSVDTADYTVWRDAVGQTGLALAADGDRNAVIDAGDYAVWKSNFGTSLGSGSGNAVPEPTSWLLVCTALALGALAATRSGARLG